MNLTTTDFAAAPRTSIRRFLWIGLVALCVIGAGAAIRRMAALAHPPRNAPSQLVSLDAEFAKKPLLTLLHIVPGLALVILIPFQFSRSFRARHLRAHRWIGRAALVLGVIIGVSGLVLIRHPIGGAAEVSAILVFDGLFLVALLKAFLHIRHGNVSQHREWMIRAMSVAVGVATVRPIMGVFFAASRRTGMMPHDFFGTAFWIGFTLTYAVAEAWIQFTRSAGRTVRREQSEFTVLTQP